MPRAIPKGLTRESVLQALADLDAGVEHPFGLLTGYELVHEGRRYPPKAVIGLACRSLLGRILLPDEFSGGEAPGQANYVLRGLGFAVERKNSGSSEEAESVAETADRGGDWTRQGVNLIVADYFSMLGAELAGVAYSKAEHNRDLRPLLGNRSKSSVEFKHQNISAVLVEMGLPYIEGYKRAKRSQTAKSWETKASGGKGSSRSPTRGPTSRSLRRGVGFEGDQALRIRLLRSPEITLLELGADTRDWM